MSGFGPQQRRAPNVSQYLANLNHIPTQHELQQQQQPDLSGFDADLDFLTNTEFFDFDQFQPSTGFADRPQHGSVPAKSGPPYQFGEFPAFASNPNLSPSDGTSPSSLHGQYPPQPQHFAESPMTGDKRKASIAMPSPADMEEASRMAAEEDKRRRNTAASARFRVKKKQREQALEKQAKEMSDKVQSLESRIQQLETENKWLKELITDKSDAKALESALDIKREKESTERSSESRTDGVGTESESVEDDA